jgi:hypothetical protein
MIDAEVVIGGTMSRHRINYRIQRANHRFSKMPGVDCGPGRQSACPKPSLFVAAVPLGAEARITLKPHKSGKRLWLRLGPRRAAIGATALVVRRQRAPWTVAV